MATYQLRGIALTVEHDGRLDLRPLARKHAATKTKYLPDTLVTESWCCYYLDMARENGQRIGDSGGAASVAKLGREFANIEAAFKTATMEPLRSVAVSAVDGLALFMLHTNTGEVGLFERLLRSCKAQNDPVGEARCRLGRGVIHRIHGAYDDARREYETALTLAEGAKDESCRAECHERLGVIALDRAQYDAARKYFRQALDFYENCDNGREVAYCLWRLAETSVVQFEDKAIWRIEDAGQPRDGSPDDVRKSLDRAFDLYKKLGVESGMANCLFDLADVDYHCGEHKAAKANYDRACSYYVEGYHKLGYANCLARFGDLAEAALDCEAARTRWRQALPLYKELDEPAGIAEMSYRIARTSVDINERAEHVQSAIDAWKRTQRNDLIKKYFTTSATLRLSHLPCSRRCARMKGTEANQPRGRRPPSSTR